MTTQFRKYSLVQTTTDFGQLFCDQTFTATLAASTDTTLTVPGGGANSGAPTTPSVNRAIAVIRVENSSQVWVAVNATAAVPAGATFAASTSELINSNQIFAKYVSVGDVLHFITPGTDIDVSVAIYALPNY